MGGKVLLISSSGGHWVEMLRVRPAFDDMHQVFASTDPDLGSQVPGHDFYSVLDASAWHKFRLFLQAIQVLLILLRVRPALVISTGASSGFFAVLFASKLGIKTIWLDSIANSEELSLSGRRAGKYADLWLTQWEHLSEPGGPDYAGSVV
jgi:UDP-N-acetylglucosamine:LPS N-acetylglucosamine transferase